MDQTSKTVQRLFERWTSIDTPPTPKASRALEAADKWVPVTNHSLGVVLEELDPPPRKEPLKKHRAESEAHIVDPESMEIEKESDHSMEEKFEGRGQIR